MPPLRYPENAAWLQINDEIGYTTGMLHYSQNLYFPLKTFGAEFEILFKVVSEDQLIL